MQNTVLSFTEGSNHCGATSSDLSSWDPLATSEGDKVISYTVWREQGARSNIISVYVTLLMSFCWCHSVDIHCECHFENWTLLVSLCLCLFIDVTLLMSIFWCHSINNKICEWATIVILVWRDDWSISRYGGDSLIYIPYLMWGHLKMHIFSL